MNRPNENEYVTIKDIQAVVPVTDRTIRNWVHLGLLPKPLRISFGYKKGVIGAYPLHSIDTARILYTLRYLPLEQRREIVEGSKSDHKRRHTIIIDERGDVIIRFKAKRAF